MIRLRPEQIGSLPPALAETLPHLPAMPGSFAAVCTGTSCQAPVASSDALRQILGPAAFLETSAQPAEG